MIEIVAFTSLRPRRFEVNRDGINKRLEELSKNGSEVQCEIESNVLGCFKGMNYCIKHCADFHSLDAFTGKSCCDYLMDYVKEL